MHYREYVRFTRIGVFFSFVAFLTTPVLSPYIKSLGFDDIQLSLIFSLFSLSIIIFSPMIGRVSDMIGRRRVILFGLIMEILAMVFYIIGDFWVVIAAARILNAVGYITVILIVLTKIEDSLDGKTRGRYTGWSLSLENASKIIAPIIGGLIADILFVTAPFYLSILLLTLLAVYFIRSKPRRRTRIRRDIFNVIAELREFLSDRKLKGMAILGIVCHASVPAVNLFLPLLIMEKFGLTYSFVGIAYFFLGFFNLFQFYFGRLCDTAGRSRVLLAGTLIYGIGLLLVSVSQSYPVLLIVLLFNGIGGSMWNISAWCLMSDIGEGMKKEGQILMSYASIAKTGTFVSFLISGFIVMLFGIEELFFLNGLLVLVGTLLAVRFFRD
ncbi:MAG TPA: MFS transporter [Candidatus Aenigmarchaeota archaeon]|nr:MFS transporter [Candidatus Aenigmarchaeota archaeon]